MTDDRRKVFTQTIERLRNMRSRNVWLTKEQQDELELAETNLVSLGPIITPAPVTNLAEFKAKWGEHLPHLIFMDFVDNCPGFSGMTEKASMICLMLGDLKEITKTKRITDEHEFTDAVIAECESRAFERHRCPGWTPPDEEDMKITRRWIGDQFRAGMTLEDCVDYWMTSEMYNRIDSEDVCLARAEKIVSKYGEPKTSSPGWERKR